MNSFTPCLIASLKIRLVTAYGLNCGIVCLETSVKFPSLNINLLLLIKCKQIWMKIVRNLFVSLLNFSARTKQILWNFPGRTRTLILQDSCLSDGYLVRSCKNIARWYAILQDSYKILARSCKIAAGYRLGFELAQWFLTANCF